MKFNDTLYGFLEKWFENKKQLSYADYVMLKNFAQEVLK